MVNNNLVFRKFQVQDFEKLESLYSCLQESYVFFKREKEFIESLFEHPGVKDEGVIIVEEKNEAVGFFVLAIVEHDVKEGLVLENVLKPGYEDDLIKYIESFFIKNGADLIIMEDTLTKNFSTDEQWFHIKDRVFMNYPLEFAEVIKNVLQENTPETFENKFVIFQTESGTFGIKKNDENYELVEKPTYKKADLIIKGDVGTIWGIVLGNSSIFKSLFSKKIRIFPFFKAPLGVKVLSSLKLKKEFYLSVCDHF